MKCIQQPKEKYKKNDNDMKADYRTEYIRRGRKIIRGKMTREDSVY